MLNLGDIFPNFEADSTIGRIKLYDFLGDSWGIIFSHPADYTPVCTTETARVIELVPEFKKRNVKLIDISCDSVDDHLGWCKDVQDLIGAEGEFPYPVVADPGRDLAVKLGMIDPVAKTAEGLPLTARAVFVIGPDKKMMLSSLYPATTGRSFSELLRAVDSLQLTATKQVATPADWQPGERCMVSPNVKDEDIPKLFPKGVTVRKMPSGKGYMRYTPQP